MFHLPLSLMFKDDFLSYVYIVSIMLQCQMFLLNAASSLWLFLLVLEFAEQRRPDFSICSSVDVVRVYKFTIEVSHYEEVK